MQDYYDSLETLLNENDNSRQLLISKIPPINYLNIFTKWLGPSLTSLFNKLIPSTEISPFFSALEYELGINNKEQNYRKAYVIYLKSAINTTDYLSMYRLFEIHFKESKKFHIKRDKILEMFFLFKSCAYLPSITSQTEIFSEFNPKNTLLTYFEQESSSFDKFSLFLDVIENNIAYTHLMKDIPVITASVLHLIKHLDNLSIFNRKENKNNPEMKLKLANLVYKKNKNYYFELLEECIKMKYNRAFLNYGIVLQIDLMMIPEALEVYRKGIEGGNFLCYNYYYYLNLRYIDYSSNESIIEGLIGNLPYLINAIVFKDFSLISEFLDIMKFIIKHKGIIPNEYELYLKEIISFLLENKNTSNYDLLFSLGLLYSFKYNDMIEPNLTESLNYFNKLTQQQGLPLSIQRSIQGRVFNIKKKLHKKGLITEDELMTTAKQFLALIEQCLVSEEQIKQNPSIHYCIGMLIEFIHGKEKVNEKLLQKAFRHYQQSALYISNYRFVFGCFVRKQKSALKIKEDKFIIISEGMKIDLEQMETPKPLSVSLLDCEICFENKLNVYFVPCSHKCCSICYEKLKGMKCPFCRRDVTRVIYF